MQDMPKEIERKFLIACPDKNFLENLPNCSFTEITQVYLIQNEIGFTRRVRKRGIKNNVSYTYTQKKKIGFGERIELESDISESKYQKLLQEADPNRKPVKKIRYCIAYKTQMLELDIYDFSQKFATLEIELPDINMPVKLPDWVKIIADVTDQKGYSNFELSLALKFPEEI